ncbi:response regulator [uncultured Paraglaciecola sp.]|uniref:response regulator n=1 Tax=uncultured Paraglaciecola sp. TaxID=1765024 RepID=UPI00260BEFFC|nr:response regulator [uncultured Paraglaciecola sp.]
MPIYENGRVLVIDDDHATLEATGALLANWGWDVDARPRLKDADIASLEKTDMIISDYELAFGETGLEVIKAIRAAHGPIPALIITGSTMPEIRQKIADAGFILLHKPVMPVQLRSAILSLMDRA